MSERRRARRPLKRTSVVLLVVLGLGAIGVTSAGHIHPEGPAKTVASEPQGRGSGISEWNSTGA